MPGTKEIRMKIRSVQNTRKITKAMEMVAASKMRKAQEGMRRARPYGEKIRNVAAHISHANPEYRHPFLVERDTVKGVGIIVVTTDKGLCGALNTNLMRLALGKYREWEAQDERIEVCAIGTKGLGFMQRLGANVVSHVVQLGDRPQMEKLIGAVKVILDGYTQDRFDRLMLFYTRFINTMKQEPVMEQLLPLSGERQELLHHRLLLHSVDEARVKEHEAVEAVLGVAVENHLHRADQLLHLRPVAELHDVRHYVGSKALHKAQALGADSADLDSLVLRFPFPVFAEREAHEIRVERAAQALVGGDDDDAHALYRVALHQKRMAVFRVRVADVRGDVADLLSVGARTAHALLRLPHLGGGDHLHRLGDLPGVLHTPDFHPDLFGAGHQKLPLFFQSSMAAFRAFSSSAERSFWSSMVFTSEAYLPFT